MKNRQDIPYLAAVALALLALVGCRDDGPPRYQIHGRVTYEGRPVPAGRVIFEPDAAAGRKGPAGYADIANGSYRTLSGKGVVGGPHQIRAICLSGAAEGELAEGRMLCPEYRTTIDLPLKSTKIDIDIPASLAW